MSRRFRKAVAEASDAPERETAWIGAEPPRSEGIAAVSGSGSRA